MSADLLMGKKGGGKSKLAVMLMREHLLDGLRVATNLDLHLDKLLGPQSRATYTRVPDKPTEADLLVIGKGYEQGGFNDEQDGLLCLDELALWLNTRTFQDKTRAGFMAWMVHSRKRRWHVLALCQDIGQIDKQYRESQVDYVIRCMALDKFRIPFVGGLLQMLFGKKAGFLPKIHMASRRLGVDPRGVVAHRWRYRTGGVQDGYNTLQEFTDDYPHGVHSVLSAWHTVGRYLAPAPTRLQRLSAWWGRVLAWTPPVQAGKLAIVASIQSALPPDERVRHVRRLVRLGMV